MLFLSLAALGIRLVIVRGFWLDEATEADYAQHSYGQMLTLLRHDNHPPLHYSIIWLIEHSLGTTEFDLRLPSIIFGTLMIPMVYLAGKALYDETAGIFGAAFTTVAPLAVWYSQEARMYALFMLLTTVTIWAQARVLRTGRDRYWIMWASASAAMIWTQWFSSFAIGTEILVFLWAANSHRRIGLPARRLMGRLSMSVLFVTIVCAPGLPLLFTQFSYNQTSGLGLSGPAPSALNSVSPYGIFNNLVWALWGYHSNGVVAHAVAIWPVGLLGLLILLGRRRSRANGMLVAIVVVPMTIVFGLSLLATKSRSLFEIRYFIEAVPAVLLLLAGAITTMAPSRATRRASVLGITLLLVVGLVLQQTDSANPRLYGYQWAFSQINIAAKPGDVILYDPTFLNVDVNYFAPNIDTAPLSGGLAGIPRQARLFLVGSFPFAGGQPDIARANRAVSTLERHRHLLRVLRAPNITVWEFS